MPKNPLAVAAELARQNLDLPETIPQEVDASASVPKADASHGAALSPDVARMMAHVARDQARIDESFASIEDLPVFARLGINFLRVPGKTFYIGGAEALEHVKVINASMSVALVPLLQQLELAGKSTDFGNMGNIEETIPPPPALEGAVEGPIVAAHHFADIGWVVIGSSQDNRYDLARVAIVIDPDGNDTYHATDLRLGLRITIDLAGDDVYTGTDDQGPASALFGLSYTIDNAGNDRYEGKLLSAGAALYGAAILLDRGGNDTYIGNEWSLGAACYGAGMILDLGQGSDQYLGEFLCEGVGGPRGFGLIVDEAGRDLYRANGPKPSGYGTPAVSSSFSQGLGFGYRKYAVGGIGMISDLAGDDRYEAGEFAQGGAYYYALGILHDAAGRDLYYGNRYAQGFGVHQAHGILADDAGDDTYWSMTAASQDAAWDIGVGLLIDRAGNDSYQADGLAQGGASQQGIALLLDLGGVDRYSAGVGSTQGQSGLNQYHYVETGAFSFSLLVDLGGDDDAYSRKRANNSVTVTGSLLDNKPQNSPLHGMVIDR